MSVVFKRSLNWAWLSVAAIAVLLAVLVTLLRFGAPWLASWQQQWMNNWFTEQRLELTVGSLGLTWQDYGPVLVMKEVSVHRGGQPTITLRRALVDVQLWQSLRQWRPILNELTLEGLRLPIALDAKDASSADTPFDWSGLRHFVLEGVEQFSLQDAQLLLNHGEQALLQLQLPDWHWHNQTDRHQGQGLLALGEQGGEQAEQLLQVRSQFSGTSQRLDGQVYVQADGVDASPILAKIRPDDTQVSAELNFELWLEWQQGQLSAGILDLGENRFGWGEQHQVAIKGGRLQWQPTTAGWQLASKDVDISVDQESWPSWHLQVERQGDHLQGSLDKLTFTDLALLAQWGESFLPTTAAQLAGIAPRGQLSDLYFSADATGKNWHWQGQLQEVSTQAFGWVPATQGLSGHFVLAPESGELSMAQAEPADWVFEQGFRGPWPLEKLSATLNWQQQAGNNWLLWSDELAIASQDLTLDGWFSLLLPPDSTPVLSASARVDVLRAGQAYRYFPEPLLGSALVDYLQGAIVAGQAKGAEVLWYGPLDAFPYQDNSGIFQARVPLRKAQFRFDPDWLPLTDLSLDLLFENDGLYMTGEQGRLGKVNASQIAAEIVPLDEDSTLKLKANIKGQGEAVSDYLQHSPLASSVGVTLEQLQITGPLQAGLALSIPLNGDPLAVTGQVDFVKNKVRVSALDLPLTNVSGRLLFDEQHTQFNDLKASWLSQPLALTYIGKDTDLGYEVELGIKGQIQAASWRHLHPALQPLAGAAEWRGQLQLSLPDTGPLHYDFSADSSLTGLSSALPPPFNKSRAARLASTLSAKGDAEQASLTLQVGEHLRSAAKLSFTEQGARVDQLWLTGGANVKTHSPRPPLDIALRVPEMVVDDWLALLADVPASSLNGPTEANKAPPAIYWPLEYRVAVHASRAQLWQQRLNQLHLLLTPNNDGQSQLSIDAEQAQGKLTFGASQPIKAHFSRLWLSGDLAAPSTPSASSPNEITLHPSQVPALDFRCDDCRWQQLGLGKLAFQLQPLVGENGLQLQQFSLDGPLIKAKASGQWLQQNSVDISRLEWHSTSPSLQRLWQAFGKESPFSETRAELGGKMRWLDAPWRPELASMTGELAVDSGSGVLRELNTKGAGLLSVLSLESVMRRLRLDFRDVFAQGFYFDGISASAQLQDGRLSNDDLLIKGAAGDLRGHGQLNFASEQLNYQLELTPHVTGNLPAIAAFAATPVAGLYVFALSKALGPVVDVFTRIRYQVTGSINEPVITELGRDQESITLPDDAE